MTVEGFDDIESLARMDVTRRRVFLRTDLATPTSSYGSVLDDTRLRLALPTIRTLLAENCKIILASQFGTPDSRPEPHHLNAIAARLAELLGVPVTRCERHFRATISRMKDGEVALFPNLLDFSEDVDNDPGFAQSIAQHVDVYVNDSLRICEQRSATLDVLPRLLPCRGAGLTLHQELNVLAQTREGPEQRFALVVGGSQLTDKIPMIRAMLPHADVLVFGGVPATTLLSVLGWSMRPADVDSGSVEFARELLELGSKRDFLVLPKDFLVQGIQSTTPHAADVSQITLSDRILDIGPETRLGFSDALVAARSVLWVGTMGRCDDDETSAGTQAVGMHIVEGSLFSVLADSALVRAVEQLGLAQYYKLLSRGDAATLALLSGATLPGV